MADESYTLSGAASVLGVSVPTLRRIIAQKRISAFRTPGGHLRITAENLSRYQSGTNSLGTAGPSSVLVNRRERLEELTLEAQELRARHEIERLHRDNEEEELRRTAEIEADERAAERATEAQRLRLERVRIQQARQEQEREEAERLAAWRMQWLEKAMEEAPDWLSPAQRKEALRVLESEISKRRPECEAIMGRITSDTLIELTTPWEAERKAKALRERIIGEMQQSLPYGTKQNERTEAEAIIRRVLTNLPLAASEAELRDSAQNSVAELRTAIAHREAEEARKLRKARLIDYGVERVGWYMLHLNNLGEIDDDEYLDSRLTRDLETAVRETLEEELHGNEPEQEVEERVHEIVDDELEFEGTTDDYEEW